MALCVHARLPRRSLLQVDIPLDRVIMGFFFSPDSKKLLCLVTEVGTKTRTIFGRDSAYIFLGFSLDELYTSHNNRLAETHKLRPTSKTPEILCNLHRTQRYRLPAALNF